MSDDYEERAARVRAVLVRTDECGCGLLGAHGIGVDDVRALLAEREQALQRLPYNDYEERARAWYLSDVSDHVSAVESLAALLREVAEEARQALADTLAPRWEEMVCAVEHLSALRAERDRLRADLAAERERYAALCIGDPASGDALVPPAPAAVTLSLRDQLAAARERCERLRAVAQCVRIDELLGERWLHPDPGDALAALHPGDLDGGDRG